MTILLLVVFAKGQFSPGPLSNAHKTLEGMNNCQECHSLGKGISNKKCLSCHESINASWEKHSGFHGSDAIRTRTCSECHGDHFGPDFDMIHFDPDTFDHVTTGYPLVNAHQEVKCEQCHNSKNIKDEELSKKESTYLGLTQNCNNCHNNIHKPSLGDDCSKCHSTVQFTKVDQFDHSKTDFQITGKHVGLACDKCHLRNNENKMVSFTVQNHRSCIGCHKDVHNNKYKLSCNECHSTESFKIISNIRNFDHSRTKFVLQGKHSSLKCETCHTISFKTKDTEYNCKYCHTDYHKGEFSEGGLQPDCVKCHNEKSFSPSIFTVTDHDQLKYKLKFKHRDVSCDKCHKSDQNWKFRDIASNCDDCHKSPHITDLASDYFRKGNCNNCHAEDSWQNINFDHGSTEYLLLEKHKTTNCKECHYGVDSRGAEIQKFKYGSHDCLQCHKSHHNEKIILEEYPDCLSCHYYDSWNNIVFNHAQTDYELTGSHIKVTCVKCHKEIVVNGKRELNFFIKDTKCKDCH